MCMTEISNSEMLFFFFKRTRNFSHIHHLISFALLIKCQRLLNQIFSWSLDDLMPTRTQGPLPHHPYLFWVWKSWPLANYGENNTVSLVINSQHLPLQQDPRSCRLHTHKHTHSALLGNNVSVNFKWIPRWISLSQVKKKKKKRKQ